MRRPLALTIVAWIFIATGLWGAASMIGPLWIEHKVNLSIDVLGLWVGPGLLRWDPRYYKWAVRLLIVSMILSPVALWAITLKPPSLGFEIFGHVAGGLPRLPVIAVALALLGLNIWQYVVLRRPGIRAGFEARQVQGEAMTE